MESLINKKAAALLILVICCTLIFSCSGKPGDVYLKYSWVSVPLYFYDENPSTPSTVYNDQYFQTEPGSYYMEYTAWDGSDWWMIYTLAWNPGKPFFIDGDDALFEITLFSSGPSTYKWQSIVGQPEVISVENAFKVSTDMDNYEVARDKPVISMSTQKISIGGVTLTIEYGKK